MGLAHSRAAPFVPAVRLGKATDLCIIAGVIHLDSNTALEAFVQVALGHAGSCVCVYGHEKSRGGGCQWWWPDCPMLFRCMCCV